ncbi:hypothetical protein HCH_06587 [Hahella chejuensis KCTC 2396]|uniref:Uncharacterized protein n=1 Tax=Hahella chejuensis (strain KCTC 2396) TaxID=349521 RepID=Q2S800_HAHCH|nr:hypothetical protein HCH_06587 [Hahella chejuensis KCTC 2396]
MAASKYRHAIPSLETGYSYTDINPQLTHMLTLIILQT